MTDHSIIGLPVKTLLISIVWIFPTCLFPQAPGSFDLKDLIVKADSLIKEGEYRQGFGVLESFFTGTAPSGQSDHHSAARINHLAALCRVGMGDPEKALEYFNAAEKEYLFGGQKNIELSELYLDKGENFLYLNGDSVLYYVDKILKLFGEDMVVSGKAFALKAFLEIYREEFKLSEKNFERARSIFERLLPLNSFEFANFYAKYANFCRKIGDFRNAELYSKQAMNIFLLYKKPTHTEVFGLINEYAISLKNTGNYSDAKKQFQTVIDALSSIFEPDDFRLGIVYNNLASCYYELGEFDQSLECFLKALEIREKRGVGANIGMQLISLGYNYWALRDSIRAMDHFGRAYDLLEGDPSVTGMLHLSNALFGMGNVMDESNDLEKARDLYEGAMKKLSADLSEENFLIPWVSRSANSLKILTNLARVNFKIYRQSRQAADLNRSYFLFQQAIRLLDIMKDYFGDPQSRQELIGRSLPLFEGAIESALELYETTKNKAYFHQAFQIAEKSKNYLLLETVNQKKIIELSAIPDSLLKKQHSIRQEIVELETGLYFKKNASFDSLERILFALKTELDEIQEVIRNYSEKFELLENPEDYITLHLFHKRNLNKSVIEYFVGQWSIYTFVFTSKGNYYKKIPIDFPLQGEIQKFREGILLPFIDSESVGSIPIQKANERMIESGMNLYKKLVLPLGELPDHLIIIPDGILGFIPFDALLSDLPTDANNYETYPFLHKKHTISYAYSVNLLQEMVQKNYQDSSAQGILAMAPFYNGNLEELKETIMRNTGETTDQPIKRKRRTGFEPLEESGEECYIPWALWGGELRLNRAASKQIFFDLAPKFRMLHLSTHSLANREKGDYSFLAFSPESDQTTHEPLFVSELYNLELQAELVAISSCDAGIGELIRGEGIISIGRAFAFAGAKSILTTLWAADDYSSKEIMNYFYHELNKGQPKDAALRVAKLNYLADHRGEELHPYFWAGFIGFGDMSPVR